MELVLRTFATLRGVEGPRTPRSWDETEARSFAQVVDGIVKLQTAGAPIEELLEDVPGWTQQRVQRVRSALRRASGSAALNKISTASRRPASSSLASRSTSRPAAPGGARCRRRRTCSVTSPA